MTLYALFQQITFSWINHFVNTQQHRCVDREDVDALPLQCQPKHVLNQFQSLWDEECRSNPDNPSLLSVAFSFINIKYRYILIIFIDCFYWGALATNIIFIDMILQYLSNETRITKERAYLCATGMTLSVLLIPLTTHYNQYQTRLLCTNIRTALTAMIYEKSLRIPNNIYNTSQIINFMSDDVQKFEVFFINLVECFGSMTLLPCLVYFIKTKKNMYILLGFVLLILLIPIFAITSPLFARYKANLLLYTDKRLKLIKEVINGYLNTKMYCWEQSVLELVQNTRKQELGYLIKKGRISAFNTSINVLSVTVVMFMIMITYFYEEGPLYVSMIYPIALLYDCLKLGIVLYLPMTLQAYYELRVSTKRIVDFLVTPEVETSFRNTYNDSDIDAPSIHIQNASFYWTGSDTIAKYDKEFRVFKVALSFINVSFEQNTFVGLIGEVGSGKTALLLAILGELELDNDCLSTDVCVNGKIGYCSQIAWIFNGSIKENILFGNKYDEEWYKVVVYSCCLDKDFGDLPHKDETIIGERGINLSGGQKTRINLARCIYTKPSILLLDDCLSSVDTVVANHIFVHLLHNDTGLMRNTLRILATHQINILPQMDQIIIMQNQKIAQINQYQNLDISDINFVHDESESKHQDMDDNFQYTVKVSNSIHSENQLQKLAQKQSVIAHEEMVTGSVPFACYLALLFPDTQSKHTQIMKFVLFCLLMFTPCMCQMACNLWLGVWASAPVEQQSNPHYIMVYAAIIAIVVILEFTRMFTIYRTLFVGATSLHNKMFESVLYSSVYFYESNPVGRILNRFSQDQFNLDEKLPTSFAIAVTVGTQIWTVFMLIWFVTPLLYIAMIPIICPIVWIIKLYIPLSRALKRLEAIAKSPIYSSFTVSFAGLSSVRAYHKQSYVLDQAYELIEKHAAVSLLAFGAEQWLGFRLNMIFCVGISITCFTCVHLYESVSPAFVGILLIYMFWVLTTLSFMVSKFAEMETYMTSTERVLEYGNLKTEEEEMQQHHCEIVTPPKNWPLRGNIEIKNLSVSYRSYLDPVLHNINVSIKDGEKVLIVGRTGSGKSTLLKACYRLLKYRNNGGYIKIDGVDISRISLIDLRKILFVIPQNCILFSSTLRYNIDPFNECSDEKLYEILREVHLSEDEFSLDSVMTEYGGNLSVGQTQLICVARALVNYSKNKILLIDEATANIDADTDEIIQQLFKTKLFKDKTVLTIAHRISNVLDYDKILVLDSGYLKEFDAPQTLLQDKDSIFYKLVSLRQ